MLLSFTNFNFKFVPPGESNFPFFFRRKISGFAFWPTSKRLLLLCAVHVPMQSAPRKGQRPSTSHCNREVHVLQRGRQHKIRDSVVKKKKFLQFSSHHSDNAKSSVARALFERVSYVTGEEKRKRESGTIEDELKLNNFPHEIIIRERRKAIKKQRERAEGRTASERTTGELETRKKATISIPYIQGTSEAIRRVLGQLGIRTAMRSSKIKWSIMKGVKDKQKEEEIPGVVYAIGCGDCRKVYVGETRRTAAQRVKEHKSDTRLGHLDKSAVAEHAHTTGHHVHWKAMVVEREQHGRKRKVKEALHIHRMTRKDGSMNQDRGLHLSKIWLDLVQ